MRANEKVLHGKPSTDQWNVKVQAHLYCRDGIFPWLFLTPVMRRREAPFYLKYLFQALLHSCDRLDIIVVRPYLPSKVSEVDVGHYELAIFIQNLPDFLELPVLPLSHVLEYAHPNDEIESLFTERDLIANKIDFPQIAGRLVDCYVETEIVDVRAEQLTQSSRSTSNIKQAASSARGQLIDDSGAFPKSETRFGIFSVLDNPVISASVIVNGFFHGDLCNLRWILIWWSAYMPPKIN
jgi:hypothetical protein